MGLRLEVSGAVETRAKLARFTRLIRDFDLLWDRYAAIMAEVEKAWFASKGDGTWAPLAKSTLAKKVLPSYRSRGKRGPFYGGPLIATGQLHRELTSVTAGEVGQGRSSLGTFTRSTFSWGTDDDVADYHDKGRVKPNFMPARPPIQWPPSPSTKAQLERANDDFVEEVLRESGMGG